MKKKAKINFTIDVLMFVMMAAIGGIGLLIKYSLISGKDQWKVYSSNVELTLWGWDRHQWGSLHLILGIILFGLLLLHILFHWKQIKGLFRHLILHTTSRIILTVVLIAIALALLIFGLVIPRDVVTLKKGEGHYREYRVERNSTPLLEKSVKQMEESSSPDTRDISHHEENHRNRKYSIVVNGSMTLKQAADAYLKERVGGFSIYPKDEELEIVGYSFCGDCPGGNVEYVPEEMINNGAEVIHLATGLVVGYPPCPRIRQFKEFIEKKYNVPVVIGTHPIPLKYLNVHKDLSFWKKMRMSDLAGNLMKEDHAIMAAYD